MLIEIVPFAPVLIVMAAAVAVWFATSTVPVQGESAGRWLGVIGLSGAMVASALLWHRSASTDLTLVIDRFALFFNLLLCGAALFVLILPVHRQRTTKGPRQVPLVLAVLAAAMVVVATDDLVVLVLGLQVVGAGTVLLSACDSRGGFRAHLAFPLVLPAAVAGVLSLYGAALAYAVSGTTQLADLMMRVAASSLDPNILLLMAVALVLAGGAWTTAVVPLHAGDAAASGRASPETTTVGLVAKVAGVAALMRVLLTTFEPLRPEWSPILSTVAGVTMIVGAAGAAAPSTVGRSLAYLGVAHTGVVLVAIAASADLGIPAALFTLTAYAAAGVGVFAALSAWPTAAGSTGDVNSLHGMAASRPAVAAAFAFCLLSLCGLPPTGGFVARWLVVGAALSGGLTALALIVALTSVVSMLVCLRLIAHSWTAGDRPIESSLDSPRILVVCLAGAVALVASLAVWPGWLLAMTNDAAAALF